MYCNPLQWTRVRKALTATSILSPVFVRNQLATRPSVEMEKKLRCLDTWRTKARSVQYLCAVCYDIVPPHPASAPPTRDQCACQF